MNFYVSIWLVIISIFSHAVSTSAFDVYWNVPSQQCKHHNNVFDLGPLLRAYGIRMNEDDKFQGGNITIFYESQLGLYPFISNKGQFVNGGIPQRGDLTKHLNRTKSDIEHVIPNKNFDGLGVIDWESWRPTWDFNWGTLRIYQDKAKEYAKELDPSLSDKSLNERAQKQWEDSARSYMLETILLAKKLRPDARWCYYLFPDCYNYEGKKPQDFQCSKAVRSGNDKLDWLWESSSAICPSIYLYASHLDKYSLQERTWKDQQKLKEAIRLASSKARLYPYVNYYLDTEMMPQEEFRRIVAQIAAVGGDGLVIWGSSASVSSSSLCNQLKAYVIDTMGPAVERVAWNSELCKKKICNGRGRCTWPNDEYAVAWKLFLSENFSGFRHTDIVCRCEPNFVGRYCEEKISGNYI